MPLFNRDAYSMMTRLIAPDARAVFIDVGANTGHTCRRIADEFHRAEVHAFEPAPRAAALLRTNTADLPGVRIVESAVGDRTGHINLHVAADDLMSSVLPASDLGRRFHGTGIAADATVRVPLTTLDDYVARAGLTRVDMVKIDVQGLETAVLAGAAGLLSRGDVLAVNCEAQLIAEYDGAATFPDISGALARHGFILHQIHECWSNGAEEQTTCLDALWLHESALARLREACGRRTPPARFLEAARHAAAAGKKSIALYGAGRHTRTLAPAFAQSPLPVVAVIDDQAASDTPTIGSVPVVAPAAPLARAADAVILSSDCYEDELWAASAPLRRAGRLVLPLYRSHPAAVPASAGPRPGAATQADPARAFRYRDYLRLNAARLDHLASLGLDIGGRRVLEVGAGVGDLTRFWVERGCTVHSTDARPDHVRLIARAFDNEPAVSVGRLDLDAPLPFTGEPYDVVFAYGLLYHLADPVAGLAYMAAACRDLLVLETCVSVGADESPHPVGENALVPSQAVSGTGCRPTRAWVHARLREAFAHVYMPATQPDHAEFPLDWSVPSAAERLTRAVFIASRRPLANATLVEGIPTRQTAHRSPPPYAASDRHAHQPALV